MSRGACSAHRTSSTGRTSRTYWGGPSSPRLDGEENGRGEEAGRGEEVARVISYLTVGPDGCRGWSINIRRGGVGQKETLADSGRQGSQEGVLEGQKLKRPQRYWQGIVALHEIFWFQKNTELLIHKLPFLHLVHEIAQEIRKCDMHFQVHAVLTLQEAAEYYLASLLEDANLCMIHTKCITIMLKDMQLAHHIHGQHIHYWAYPPPQSMFWSFCWL